MSESDFCDNDTLDAPTASLVSVSRYGPALVDHVPNRPGTRPTDASTLVVVVDPSEVSTVGDMTYEEQQYGPVVDHLPPAQSMARASGTGSTVNADAATASVGPDDTLIGDSSKSIRSARGAWTEFAFVLAKSETNVHLSNMRTVSGLVLALESPSFDPIMAGRQAHHHPLSHS